MAAMTKCWQYINLADPAGNQTWLFEPDPCNLYIWLEGQFPYEDHLYFYYDAFGDLTWDSLNAVSPWHQ
jgi:hypothetical protein